MYKNGHFSNFFLLGNKGQEKVFVFDILEGKNAFLGYKNKMFKKSKNCHFSKGVNPWFWSKNGHFFNFFFLGKIGQENVFYDILERKNTFLGYKNKKFEKSKNCIILKRLIHGFWTKMSFFGTSFFYCKIDQKNVFDHILERKNAFLASKKQKIKKSKNWEFSKGVNPRFWIKNGQFFNFFF